MIKGILESLEPSPQPQECSTANGRPKIAQPKGQVRLNNQTQVGPQPNKHQIQRLANEDGSSYIRWVSTKTTSQYRILCQCTWFLALWNLQSYEENDPMSSGTYNYDKNRNIMWSFMKRGIGSVREFMWDSLA